MTSGDVRGVWFGAGINIISALASDTPAPSSTITMIVIAFARSFADLEMCAEPRRRPYPRLGFAHHVVANRFTPIRRHRGEPRFGDCLGLH